MVQFTNKQITIWRSAATQYADVFFYSLLSCIISLNTVLCNKINFIFVGSFLKLKRAFLLRVSTHTLGFIFPSFYKCIPYAYKEGKQKFSTINTHIAFLYVYLIGDVKKKENDKKIQRGCTIKLAKNAKDKKCFIYICVLAKNL